MPKPDTPQYLRWRDLGAALMWALALSVFANELTTPAGVAAAGIGGFAGYFCGHSLANSRFRTPVVVTGLPVLGWIFLWAAELPANNRLMAEAMGASVAYSSSAFLGCLAGALGLVSWLKFLSSRHPAWVGAEVALVTLFLAAPFAAHRDGFINRPHFLVDPLWSRGYDPMLVLFALGAVAAGAVILLTIGRHSKRSTALDLAILLAIVGCLYVLTPENVIKDWIPDPPTGLGLTGEPNEGAGEGGQPEDGEQQGGGPTPPNMDGSDGENDNNEIPFKDNYDQNNKPKPVAVVILRDDYEPPEGGFYFRQSAQSQFNGRRLIADTTGLADGDIATSFPVEKERISDFFPGLGTHKLLKTRVALIASHTNPFGLVNMATLEPAPNPDPEHFERAYDVESWVRTVDYEMMLTQNVGSTTWPKAVMDHYTKIPDDPRYQELAQKIIGELPEQYRNNKVAWAIVIKLYLDKQGIYSRRSNHMSAEDPVASFLFGNKTGYCVHFAHAAAYLYRSVGVPARVAGGYFIDARFRQGSALMIRDRESHAWPEIYLTGFGWVPLDISPERSLDKPMMQPDPDLSRMLGEMARDEQENEDKPARKSLREILRQLLQVVVQGTSIFVVLAILALYFWKAYRAWSPYWSDGPELARALYRAGLDRLCDAGVRRGFGQGRSSFAEQIARDFGALAPLTEIHLSASLGDPSKPVKVERSELFKHFRELKTQLRTVPWWRRLLGAINPFTPLLVK